MWDFSSLACCGNSLQTQVGLMITTAVVNSISPPLVPPSDSSSGTRNAHTTAPSSAAFYILKGLEEMHSSDEEEVDPELLRLFQERLATGSEFPAHLPDDVPTTFDTHVLSSAEYIVNQAVDVALDPRATKDAARLIAERMRTTGYSTKTWSSHELHPYILDDDGDERRREIVDFIFTMDLLNFCFWPDKAGEENRFTVLYKDKKWTGYWSLVAALQMALDKGVQSPPPSVSLTENER